VIGRDTDSIRPTGAWDFTGVLTLSIVAGCCYRTVRVSQALVRGSTAPCTVYHSTRRALALIGTHCVHTHSCGITGAVLAFVNVHTLVYREEEAWLTLALRNMILADTGTLATIDNAAGIYASVVGYLAYLVLCAVIILFTLHLGAAKRRAWVTNMLIKTPAEGFMILNLTVCISATLGPFTGVNTLPETAVHNTGKNRSTVPVSCALIWACATFHKWVAHQSRWTKALIGPRNISAGC